MITITVKYFGLFSQLANKKEEKIRLKDGVKVADLLKELTQKYGSALKDELETERAYKTAMIVKDGVKIEKDTPLEHCDEINLLFPVGGG